MHRESCTEQFLHEPRAREELNVSPAPKNQSGRPVDDRARSGIRTREEVGNILSPTASRNADAAARHQAIESRIAVAQSVLASLPANDPRAALLALAIRRHDAALVEGLLAEITASPGRSRHR
ncbi:hypothetical protein ACFL5O_00480 [Myxococcota bacterium]